MSDNGAARWEVEYTHAQKLLRAFGRLYYLPEDSEWEFVGGNLRKKEKKAAAASKTKKK